MNRLTAIAGLMLCAAAPSPAQHIGHSAPSPSAPAIADPFARGLYLLHNFEYDSAAAAFRDAQTADPNNVLAFWGEAMTYNHPLWAYQDTAAARAVLARLGPDPAARRAKARDRREAMWLDAVEALYGEGDKLARDRAYHSAMSRLFEADRSDIDARAFLALATLGLASEGRDTALYMRAAALLEEAFPANPDHPGLLHYMIHSYDDPVHAPLGERAAARYAKVAPDAGHAQHMISHIYLALGRWDAVETANTQAVKVVNAHRAKRGEAPAHCGHYNEWLAYALDQQGKDGESLVRACRREAEAEIAKGKPPGALGAVRSDVTSWTTIAVRHGVDTGQWSPPLAIPGGDNWLIAKFDQAYARLLQSRRDPVAAAAARDAMRDLHSRVAKALPVERPDDHESLAWYALALVQADAIVALAQGKTGEGMSLLLKSTEAEDALPVPFGPPVLAKPSWELLGDERLAAGDKAGAAAAYRRALSSAPGRRRASEGLRQATS